MTIKKKTSKPRHAHGPPQKSYFVNKVIKLNRFKSYLELGTHDANNCKSMFYHIECENKFGVDRLFKTHFTGLAEDFLKQNKKKFECIYIDCDYSFQGSYQLALQSKDSLHDDGMIIMNFADPMSEEWQLKEPGPKWIGQVWKTAVKLHHNDHEVFDVVIIKNNGEEDGRRFLPLDSAEGITHGLAIIRVLPEAFKKNKGPKIRQTNDFNNKLLDYSFYEQNKSDIMNIVSVKDFFSKYCTYKQHLDSSKQFWSKKNEDSKFSI